MSHFRESNSTGTGVSGKGGWRPNPRETKEFDIVQPNETEICSFVPFAAILHSGPAIIRRGISRPIPIRLGVGIRTFFAPEFSIVQDEQSHTEDAITKPTRCRIEQLGPNAQPVGFVHARGTVVVKRLPHSRARDVQIHGISLYQGAGRRRPSYTGVGWPLYPRSSNHRARPSDSALRPSLQFGRPSPRSDGTGERAFGHRVCAVQRLGTMRSRGARSQ
jgi:hypothetical protein